MVRPRCGGQRGRSDVNAFANDGNRTKGRRMSWEGNRYRVGMAGEHKV